MRTVCPVSTLVPVPSITSIFKIAIIGARVLMNCETVSPDCAAAVAAKHAAVTIVINHLHIELFPFDLREARKLSLAECSCRQRWHLSWIHSKAVRRRSLGNTTPDLSNYSSGCSVNVKCQVLFSTPGTGTLWMHRN